MAEPIRDAVWSVGSDGSKESCLTWESRSPVGRGNVGVNGAHCKLQGHSAVTCVKIAEPIVMQFGLWAWSASRNHEIDGVPFPQQEGAILGEGSPL